MLAQFKYTLEQTYDEYVTNKEDIYSSLVEIVSKPYTKNAFKKCCARI